MSAKAHFAQTFNGFKESWNGAPAWLRSLRNGANARLQGLEFPTAKVEDWKYTSLKSLLSIPFAWSPELVADELTLGRLLPDLFDDPRLVFVNGVFSEKLSSTRKLSADVVAMSLAAAMQTRPELEERLGVVWKDRPFAALNTAFLTDGAYVYVPSGVRVEETLHIVYLSTGASTPRAAHPRNLITVRGGSKLNVVEAYIGNGSPGAYFNNALTEVTTHPNSSVSHYKVQHENRDAFHVSNTQVTVGRDSRYVSQNISLGAALARNDLGILMKETGGDATLNGLFVTDDTQHVDNHTLIDHAVPHCDSRELYKGILSGKSRGVFDGRIIVRPDAQKTTSEQNNRNLLLSDDAVVDSKPQLEIFADDVKCAHGTAIGRLDEDSIYYLRSRGFAADDARALMVHAFAGEVIEQMTLQCVRGFVDDALWDRIPNGGRLRPDERDARICIPFFGGGKR